MKLKGLELVTEEKVNRAINGTIGREGRLVGGVGKDATPEVLIAEYDRLAGAIRKEGRKVVTGCYWNFKDQVAHKDPKIIFTFRGLDGKEVLVPEGQEVPLEVKAAELVKAPVKKVKKVKK